MLFRSQRIRANRAFEAIGVFHEEVAVKGRSPRTNGFTPLPGTIGVASSARAPVKYPIAARASNHTVPLARSAGPLRDRPVATTWSRRRVLAPSALIVPCEPTRSGDG